MFVMSHVNSCLHLSKKWLLMRFILSVVLERKVIFLSTLEEYDNCLPNKKWMGVKHVSIVFGQTYVNGAILIISSTSNNIVCSSSKKLGAQKNDQIYSNTRVSTQVNMSKHESA